jgi:uncharacterized RDD family membrane protein YckC
MDNSYPILTPEKVVIELQIAGLPSRIGAFLIDVTIFLVLVGVLLFSASATAFLNEGLGIFLLSTGILGLFLAYWSVQEALFNGKTIGKFLTGLRVRMADGSPITPGAAFLRNVALFVDLLPSTGAVGLLCIFFSPRSQRLGDLLAGTIVVKETPTSRTPSIVSPLTQTEHPLEPLVGDVRKMSLEEYLAVKTLCDRFPELPPPVQGELLKKVWLPVANRLNIALYNNIHPIYLMEAVVMKYAREKGLL